MLTKSKKIGVTGPVEVGDAKTYIDGFTQGVASVDPAHQGLQDLDRLLLGRGADDRSGQDAHRRRRGRADRLVAVGGRLHRRGQGAKGNVLWFGTQQNQASLAPELVVASQVYDWTGMLKEMIAKRKAGKLGGETYVAAAQEWRSEDRLQSRATSCPTTSRRPATRPSKASRAARSRSSRN